MTAETYESQQLKGQRLQAALRLNPGAGPSKLVLPNPEWQEADRLGRQLLGYFDAQDQARHNPPAETCSEGDES